MFVDYDDNKKSAAVTKGESPILARPMVLVDPSL